MKLKPYYYTKEITDRLHCSRERVEKWISLGIFKLSSGTSQGVPSRWSPDDAIRLQATMELASARVSIEASAQHGKQAAWGEDLPGRFLVVTPHGDATVSSVVGADDLASHLACKPKAIILNLDILRDRVTSALAD